jgi:hypothetical protein
MRLIVELPSGATTERLAPLKAALADLGLMIVQQGSTLRTVPTGTVTAHPQRVSTTHITRKKPTWPPGKGEQ